MTGLLRNVLTHAVFGMLTLLAFFGFNMMPESATAADVAREVSEFLTPKTFNIDNVLRVDDDLYAVTYDDSVSTEVLGTQTVRKIGYGKSEIVTITSTPSGTYSSDAMFSPHVKYPGVEVSHIATVKAWVIAGDGEVMAIAIADANSFADVQVTGESFLILAQ